MFPFFARFLLLQVVVVLNVMYQTSGQRCYYPESWRSIWWLHYTQSYTNTWYRQFFERFERNLHRPGTEQVQITSLVKRNAYKCSEMREEAPYHYFVRYRLDNPKVKECVRISLNEQRTLMIHSAFSTVFQSCDFGTGDSNGLAENYCSWRPDHTGSMQWAVHTGSSGYSSARGDEPLLGHDDDVAFLYVEMERTLGEARIFSPLLGEEGDVEVCLQFKYIFFVDANELDSLRVNSYIRGVAGAHIDVQELWKMNAHSHDRWKSGILTVNVTSNQHRVEFEAVSASGLDGVIAIDQITMTHGTCDQLFIGCDFGKYDRTLCGLIQDTDDFDDWIPTTFASSSLNTGPNSDFSGSRRYYLYVGATYGPTLERHVRIHTPPLRYSGPACVKFVYFLYGVDIVRLEVYTQLGTKRETFWSIVGEQGQRWIRAALDVHIPHSDYMVGFDGIVGRGILGDIAIDNVAVRFRRCDIPNINVTVNLDVETCTSPDFIDRFTLPVDVFVKYPFEFPSVRCPYPDGNYHVTVGRILFGRHLLSCSQDKDSRLEVLDGTMTVHSCVPGNSYITPFNGTRLQCIGNMPPELFGSENSSGDAFVAGYHVNEIPGKDKFYTVRYRTASNGHVMMSVQGRTSDALLANPEKRYDSVGKEGRVFDYTLYMEPLICSHRLVSCENGATCQDLDDDGFRTFQCLCVAGFTGQFCETDVNDCPADETCSGGQGTCVDDEDGYHCQCHAGFSGQQCEVEDTCEGKNCGNGTCESLPSGYRCTCFEHYVGTHCEYYMRLSLKFNQGDDRFQTNQFEEGKTVAVECVFTAEFRLEVGFEIYNGSESVICYKSDSGTSCDTEVVLSRRDNNREWWCEASLRGKKYKSLRNTVAMIFLARHVKLSEPLPSAVSAGSTVRLECVTDTAVPHVKGTWWRNGRPIDTREGDAFTTRIQRKQGEFAANFSINVLSFRATAEMSGDVFDCALMDQEPALVTEAFALAIES